MSSYKMYKAVIFDVDGTLYDQRKLRLYMSFELLKYYLLHITEIKDSRIISYFRTWHEQDGLFSETLESDQYDAVAAKLGTDVDKVRNVINKWMYIKPIPYIKKCCDEALRDIIIQLRNRGILTVAYSDYPVDDKLKALGIDMDFQFCSTDPNISCLKPNPRGITAILNQLGLLPSECLFIGDRYEKDGKSAQSVGMDFLILPAKLYRRKAIVKDFLEA